MFNVAGVPARHSRLFATPSDANLVFDGNSITEGQPASYIGGWPRYMRDLSPVIGSAGFANVAIGGQTTQNMLSDFSDVTAAHVAGKTNILIVMEGTNQNSATGFNTPSYSIGLLMQYIAAVRAAKTWAAVLVGIPPPCYLGDQATQQDTNDWNARLDAYNAMLRRRWPEFADGLFDLRAPGSPYAQSRYPDYLRSTFFSDTVIDGISNNASFVSEGGGTPNQKIHPTRDGHRLIARYVEPEILRLRL